MTDLLPALANLLTIFGAASLIMSASWHHAPDAASFFAISRSLKGVWHIPEDDGPIADLIEIVGHINGDAR